jgi:hypothetical protein
MSVDLVGDGGKSRPSVIGDFEHWWNAVQKQCEPRRTSGRRLALVAWNAALERAAKECGAMQLGAYAVDYAAVCRQFQVDDAEDR